MRDGRDREGKIGIIKGEMKKKVEIEDENGDTAEGKFQGSCGDSERGAEPERRHVFCSCPIVA